MKKYFSILIVALVALSAATSCQLEEGTEPDHNRANRLLWSRVETALNGQYEQAQVVALLNDYMLGIDRGEANEPMVISEKEGVYTLSSNITYRVNTNGKRLNEGGEWVLYVKYGSYMEFEKMGIVEGVVGEDAQFSIESEAYLHSPYYSAQRSDVEYLFNDVEEMYEFTFTTCNGISTDTNNASSSMEYVIEFEATEPLVYTEKSLWSGKVDIHYKDNVAGTERNVTADIDRRFVTFI